jgi:membrane dipeptidase
MREVIVDGHLDLAVNALFNARDLTLPLAQIRARETYRDHAVAMTSLPELGDAGVAVVIATLFAQPAESWVGPDLPTGFVEAMPAYSKPEEAEAAALAMLELYERWVDKGHIRLITSAAALGSHLARFADDSVPGIVIALEGADPVLAPERLERFVRRGLRIVGLAWDTTRYAGGTGSSAPLSPLGRELLTAMAEQEVIHDAAHLSEESFWESVDLPCRAFCVSHATARRLHVRPGPYNYVPLNRLLSDEQIVAAAQPRGVAGRGMIGLALLNDFLEPDWDPLALDGRPVVSVERQVRRHLAHIAGLAGWESVGLGTDVDAGNGRDETPAGLDSCADWARLGDVVPEQARAGVLGGNWLRFLREALPQAD